METPEQPQLYLITPPSIDLDLFPDQLARVLDGAEIACIRLALASRDEDLLSRAADACREVAHARDIALVIADHVLLAQRLGLDGVHLSDAARSVRSARKELGADAIVGSFCGTSRHDGMNAGEAGADYVAFGPVGAHGLDDGSVVDPELFEWWSAVIEVPVVAEGGLTPEMVRSLAAQTDFFGIGDEIWGAEDPLAALKTLTAAMG
ncbi:thiamine phosphate synthase [Ruegeria pomeroyi]|uniref:Thiamine phosphate synthase n=1 Tax=Ruegeria alba TaxID=2916756 RepID=A0ABS9NSF6_9RHOB|nr:thiamine phosphate synthase [Ruegeria alba]MCE8511666.1 thiamine phosphate synthase [Ruegeria pomeroyi]MCE8520096.1 thiamine phosphate synthase [Ruegeria pomeroyi]MCE8523776.1 thiamine phosphate synthase [Ruegeria pomeroyi]MCE8527663.1 thiamine phosphate synthase [Ruegeria pomeroyi]MCE8532492.1 thiamine phosphate synthase [Ruegeria pomeroyi]